MSWGCNDAALARVTECGSPLHCVAQRARMTGFPALRGSHDSTLWDYRGCAAGRGYRGATATRTRRMHMGTIVEMTRAEVVEAISRERLTADVFSTERADRPPTEACAFCAVGSVVRRAMANSEASGDIAKIADGLVFGMGWAGENGRDRVMKQLSDTYECAVMDVGDRDDAHALEAGRAAAIAFVQSPAFPDTIRIDIGSASPRVGMRVAT